MVDFVGSIPAVALGAAFALLAVWAFVLKGLSLIWSGVVGVLVKRLGGKKMPPGQVIARHGAIGTQVASGKVGVVTAQDGQPLPPKFIVAPQPEISPSAAHPSSRPHNFFQDGQAFLESGGFRGPQLDTLQPGRYYINPILFQVQIDDVAEVPPGFVAVLRSNIGEELDQANIQPVPVTDSPDFDQTIHAAVERLL